MSWVRAGYNVSSGIEGSEARWSFPVHDQTVTGDEAEGLKRGGRMVSKPTLPIEGTRYAIMAVPEILWRMDP